MFIEYDFCSNIYLYQCVDKIALEESSFTKNSSSSLFLFSDEGFLENRELFILHYGLFNLLVCHL